MFFPFLPLLAISKFFTVLNEIQTDASFLLVLPVPDFAEPIISGMEFDLLELSIANIYRHMIFDSE